MTYKFLVQCEIGLTAVSILTMNNTHKYFVQSHSELNEISHKIFLKKRKLRVNAAGDRERTETLKVQTYL